MFSASDLEYSKFLVQGSSLQLGLLVLAYLFGFRLLFLSGLT